MGYPTCVSSATLRTKTGCLTCRVRRKKCNEQKPQCSKCMKSNRVCSWPTQDDMRDRRHRRGSPVPRTASVSSLEPVSPDFELPEPPQQRRLVSRPQSIMVAREISPCTDLVASGYFKSDLEVDCFRHFVDEVMPPLILPTSHASFRAEYLPAITNMMPMFGGLKNVVLACGASHKQFHTGNADLYQAGLNFYSQAVSEVGQALHLVDWKRDGFEDSVLLAVVMLYLHGVIFCGTRRDIRKHLAGAIQLMTLRCAQSQKAPISRPFDRIIWESILYQSFRQSVRHPFWNDYQPNDEFCDFAEEVLGNSGFSYMTDREKSPVIGFPLKLQKFIISVVRVSQRRVKPDRETLDGLDSELQYWESMVVDEQDCVDGGHPDYLLLNSSERAEVFNQHSTSLHILATSLLLLWVKNSDEVSDQDGFHLPPPIDSWQVDRALKIMTCPEAKRGWTRCYLGSWPTLIFGYAASDLESVEILRRDVQERTALMCSGEDSLVLDELEMVWRQRGFTRGELMLMEAKGKGEEMDILVV